MSNMSYCRFENTSMDLQDCIDSLENFNDDPEEGLAALSHTEKRKAEEMREQCETYIRVYDEQMEELENQEEEE